MITRSTANTDYLIWAYDGLRPTDEYLRESLRHNPLEIEGKYNPDIQSRRPMTADEIQREIVAPGIGSFEHAEIIRFK